MRIQQGWISCVYWWISKAYRWPSQREIFTNPECEKLLGEELTEHTGDMEYEYWRLVRSYAETILLDMRENKGNSKTKPK